MTLLMNHDTITIQTMKRAAMLGSICLSALALTACSQPVKHMNTPRLIQPNHVEVKTVDKPVMPTVKASVGIGNNPAVVKAYKRYQQTGQLETIRSKNGSWVTYPYSSTSKPIIACSMYHFCIVELEAGEKLNSYSLGDTVDWKTNAFVTGEGKTASISIQLKPVKSHLSTDLTISTNKRTYLIGLVSKKGANTTVLRFYYPKETMQVNLQQVNQQLGQASTANGNGSLTSLAALSGTQIDINHLNFNYKIKGSHPRSRPIPQRISMRIPRWIPPRVPQPM